MFLPLFFPHQLRHVNLSLKNVFLFISKYNRICCRTTCYGMSKYAIQPTHPKKKQNKKNQKNKNEFT